MYQGDPSQYFGCLTYSQHGEDLLIASLFQLMGVETGTYVDLGAHHPTNISNTALLYKRGWAGLNIEANANLIHAFQIERPRDKTLNVGVGPNRGKLKFYMIDQTSGLNSFDKDEIARSNNPIRWNDEIEVITLNDVIGTHCAGKWPHFLNMDLEGFDYDTISATAWPSHMEDLPLVVCIEIRKYDSQRFKDLLFMVGYFCLCRMGENLIFVRKDKEGIVR